MDIGDEYNPYRLFVGSFIPNWLLRRTEISPGAKLCFARLCQFAGEQGECFPSQSKLCEELGTSDRQIKRYIVELKEAGLIKVVQQGLNRPNIYRFLYHEWMDSRIRVSDRTDMTLPDRTDMTLQEVPKMSLQEVPKMALPSLYEENQLRESTDRLTADDQVKLTQSKESVGQSVSPESLFSMCKRQSKSISDLITSAVKKHGKKYVLNQVEYCNAECRNLRAYRKLLADAIEGDYGSAWKDDQIFGSTLDSQQKEALEKKRRSEIEAQKAESERQKQKQIRISSVIESLPAEKMEKLKSEFVEIMPDIIRRSWKKQGWNSLSVKVHFAKFIADHMEIAA